LILHTVQPAYASLCSGTPSSRCLTSPIEIHDLLTVALGNTQGNAAGRICGGHRRGCEVLLLYICSMSLTCTQISYSPCFQGGSPSRSEQTTRSIALVIPVTRPVFALSSLPLTPVEKAPHEHVILEFLFKSVFESRFINMKPTGSF